MESLEIKPSNLSVARHMSGINVSPNDLGLGNMISSLSPKGNLGVRGKTFG
jgi:hypothetical protein